MTCEVVSSEICRVCLKSSENVTNIFKTKINSVLVAEIVSICSSSYIWEEDGMPNSVCEKCLKKLESYWELRSCIKSSELILRSSLESRIDNVTKTINEKELAPIINIENCNKPPDKGIPKPVEDVTIKVEPESFRDALLEEINKEIKTEELHKNELDNEMIDFVICEDKNVDDKDIDAHKLLSDVLDLDMSVLKDDMVILQNGCENLKTRSKHKRQKVSQESILLCGDCDSEFESHDLLDLHHKLKHAKIKCKSCKKSFSPDKLKVHNETVHTGSKMFKCQICNSYISLKYYDMHMAVHK